MVELHTPSFLAMAGPCVPALMNWMMPLSLGDKLAMNDSQSILRAALVPGSSASLLRTS
jgi:hypothetical protein